MQARLFTASALLPDIMKQNESPKVTSATIIRTRERWELFCGLTIQPTFRNATTRSVFPAKCRLKKAAQKFHTGDVSPPRSGKCFLLVEANSLPRRPTRSSTQIWRVKGHQHGISALVPQTSYRRETSHWVVALWNQYYFWGYNLPPTNQTCLATNQVVTGCGKKGGRKKKRRT